MTWAPDYDPTEELLHGADPDLEQGGARDTVAGSNRASSSAERHMLALQERCQRWWEEVREYRLFAGGGFLRYLEFDHIVTFCQREMGRRA